MGSVSSAEPTQRSMVPVTLFFLFFLVRWRALPRPKNSLRRSFCCSLISSQTATSGGLSTLLERLHTFKKNEGGCLCCVASGPVCCRYASCPFCCLLCSKKHWCMSFCLQSCTRNMQTSSLMFAFKSKACRSFAL